MEGMIYEKHGVGKVECRESMEVGLDPDIYRPKSRSVPLSDSWWKANLLSHELFLYAGEGNRKWSTDMCIFAVTWPHHVRGMN